MFAIIITEKGGTERREVFDKTEVNVGRVQGNEMMLPKGNVSKHHARLLYRDGRFIVTDLKSTNGTYVNGRKITQATIVREGDKIYVGDFILRLEVPPPGAQQSAAAQPAPIESVPPHPPLPTHTAEADAAPQAPSGRRDGPVSHYPLENDPDEASGAAYQTPQQPVRMPAPPRLPTTVQRPAPTAQPAPTPTAAPLPRAQHTPAQAPTPVAHLDEATSAVRQPAPRLSSPSNTSRPSSPRMPTPIPFGSVESVQIPSIRLALFTLVGRVEEMLDLSILDSGAPPDASTADRIERAIRDEAPKLRAAAEISPEVDLETLVNEAHEELLGYGALQSLLSDDDVIEIQIQHHSSILSVRASGGRRPELPFSSEQTLHRAIMRLCVQSGAALGQEAIVDAFLPSIRAQLVAVFPPVAQTGVVATIRKRPQSSLTFEELVRAGALSRGMATFLTHAVTGKLNILVAGSPDSGAKNLLAAFAAAAPNDRMVVVQDSTTNLGLPRNAASFVVAPGVDAYAIRGATQLRPDRLLVSCFERLVAAEVVEAISGGSDGVIAISSAPTIRHALGRAVPEIAAARPGLPIEAAREWLSASFDLLIEFARLRDGRQRVIRIAEIAGVEHGAITTKDIFSFVVERTASGGALEGSFHPSGLVPKAVEALGSRGINVEQSLFRR